MIHVTVWVTMSDIANGKPGDPCACPIALAMKRAGLPSPEVYEDEIVWQDNGEHVAETSPTVREFIRYYDSGGTTIPIHFHLEERWQTNAQKRGVV
jgi:hypothetical protein